MMIHPRQLYETSRDLYQQRLQEAERDRLAALVRQTTPGWRTRLSLSVADTLIATGVALRTRTQAASR
jgi:hypothetical protein